MESDSNCALESWESKTWKKLKSIIDDEKKSCVDNLGIHFWTV